MPTARKSVAKKTAAKKTAAPRQNQTEKAVEAALKVYKSRVASQVRHYVETGDLCDEEYRNIRRELDLEAELESKDGFRLILDIRGTLDVQGGCGDVINAHDEAMADAIVKFLEEGFTVECGNRSMTAKVMDTNLYESSIQEWD